MFRSLLSFCLGFFNSRTQLQLEIVYLRKQLDILIGWFMMQVWPGWTFEEGHPETVGIGKTLVGVHTSTYSNLNTPTTKKALSFLLASHFLDKIYPLRMQKSLNSYGSNPSCIHTDLLLKFAQLAFYRLQVRIDLQRCLM